MIGYETSFARLFEPRADPSSITRVEIPIYQRDYAQGRRGAKVARIRGEFLEALRKAVSGEKRLTLDFVYGEVRDGVFRPLDGQQRLTTVFLLHWYLAARSGRLDERSDWKALSYETRPSAREFCDALTKCSLEGREGALAKWIQDRAWYRYTWDHDPTIESMLHTLDDIDRWFADVEAGPAWDRLVREPEPWVTFYVLPVQGLGSPERLYIKMNSRGRELTAFETFKARIEQILDISVPAKSREFAANVDQDWSDLLWRFRDPGRESAIDDNFLRYFEFLIDICGWRDGYLPEGSLAARAERVFGTENPRAGEHVDFVFEAFDTWVKEDVSGWFDSMFASASTGSPTDGPPGRVVRFDTGDVNLFAACCRAYGIPKGSGHVFSLPLTLLLYGVILHRIGGRGDPGPKLRVLRNLIWGSENEVVEEQMPVLLSAVDAWIEQDRLSGGDRVAFNSAQVEDEQRKAKRLAEVPGLTAAVHRLEDHPLLQGRLSVFDLEAEGFEKRAAAFHRLYEDQTKWLEVSGALLARGDYSRWKSVGFSFQLGSAKNAAPWRAVLAQANYGDAANTRVALEKVLDEVVRAAGTLETCLASIQQHWIDECLGRGELGWRYYLVKYPVMRQGLSGLYIDRGNPDGFTMCMLDFGNRRARHWDPYLSAIRLESGALDRIREPKFNGYEAETKGLELDRSNTRLTSAVSGFKVVPPSMPENVPVFEEVCRKHGVADGLLNIPQVKSGELLCDQVDRVQRAVGFVRDLLGAGL